MRIAFVTGRFPVLSEPFILNQITGTIARGCDVDVFAVQGPPNATDKVHPDFERFGLKERTHYPPQPPADKSLRPAAIEEVLDQLAATHPCEARALRQLQQKSATPPWKMLLRGAAIAARGPYDVIHCQFGFFAEAMLMLRDAGVHDAAVVTTFRGGDISRYVDQQGADVYRRTFADGDHFLANCAFFRDKAVAIGCPKERIEVHGSGIDLSRFEFIERKGPSAGAVHIATTGRLVEKKGLPYILDAIEVLRQKGRDVHCHLLGDGPMKEALQAQAEDLGIEDAVTFHGWLTQSEIIATLAKCHLFVAASVTAENGDQDAPVNTLKEAMAMGMPVVATLHGGIPELVVDDINGYLVPERDGLAIARAIERLMNRKQDWPTLGHAGREAVEAQFDMVRLNDRLVALYAELVAARSNVREVQYGT